MALGIMGVDGANPSARCMPASFQNALAVFGRGRRSPVVAGRVAKRPSARCGAALCGVLGVVQHTGLWPALIGGVAWVIVADHAGHLLRRRYGPRVTARLPAPPARGVGARLTARLSVFVGPPQIPYRVFALANAGGAVLWGAAFVVVGYLGADYWHSSVPTRDQPAVLSVVLAVVLGITAAAAGVGRRVSRRPARSSSCRMTDPAHPMVTSNVGEHTSAGASALGVPENAERDTQDRHRPRCPDGQGELPPVDGIPAPGRGLSLGEVDALDTPATPAARQPGSHHLTATPASSTAAPLAVFDEGSGPAVVLLHGQPGSMLTWARVSPLLSKAGLRVLAVDRPGYGHTGGPALDVFANAAAVRDLLDQRGLDRAVLVGHSLDAAVAVTVAACYPQRVRALVLVAPVGGPGTLDVADRVLAGTVLGPTLAWLGFRGLGALLSRATLGALIVEQTAGIDPIEVVEVLDRLRHGPLWRTFHTEQRALVRDPPRVRPDREHRGAT